jgi:dipeptidyl aminopeptidase/acylaminoacyl peptidase
MKVLQLISLLLVSLLGVSASPAHAQQPVATRPYEELFVESLRARAYGGGEFNVERDLQATNAFTRSLINFTSDDLKVFGFMNTPRGSGPFPVVLVLHGYVNPRTYRTPFTYTQRYADALARAGFLVIHPDYRGHGRSEGSQEEGNLFRTGYAIDVLNLIEHVKRLPNARPGAIGLFGHSMGGGISIRVLTVNPDVKAAVLYGSMSGDERLNVDRIKNVFSGASTMPEDDVPLGKPVEYFSYSQGGHSLRGRNYTTLMGRVVRFFRAQLK